MGNVSKISFDNSEWPIENRKPRKDGINLPIEVVDQLADELVAEYQNPDYRKWYVAVIYEFGYEKVKEWQRRAAEGTEPGKLFTKYVSDARRYHQVRRTRNDD